MIPVPVLHALTTDGLLLSPRFISVATSVMEAAGARGAVHLRGEHVSARQRYALALALAPIADRTGCRVVINDRADLALAAGAWGTQLTSRSIRVAELRHLRPNHPVGASVHTPAEAADAADAGASWLVAGHVFETASHPGEPARGTEFIVAALAGAGAVPVVAIGGLTPERVRTVRALGVHGIAVIRGIWGASDAGAAATDYLTAYDDAADDAGDVHDHGERPTARDSRG